MNEDSKCRNILKETGPLLGSQLSEKLVEHYEVTPVNARKIIQREYEKQLIQSTKPVAFQHRQYLYFLENQNITKVLPSAFQSHRKSIYRVYQAFIHNNGLLLKNDLIKIAAATTDIFYFPKSETEQKLIDTLLQLAIIDEPYEYSHIPMIKVNPTFMKLDTSINEYSLIRGQYINFLFTQFAMRWLEKNNIIGWNQGKIFTPTLEKLEQNGHLWDGIGYTYMYGYYKLQDDQNGRTKTPSLVFIESNFHRITQMEDVEGFFTRITMQDSRLTNFPQGNRILPILLINGIDKDALVFAREKGAMITSLREILNNSGAKLIEFLINPWKQLNVLAKCDKFIHWIKEEKIASMDQILSELQMIKQLYHFKTLGWKSRQNVTFLTDGKLHHLPWVLYEADSNKPYLCGYLDENQLNLAEQIHAFIKNEYLPYLRYSLRSYKGEEHQITPLLFSNNGDISSREDITELLNKFIQESKE